MISRMVGTPVFSDRTEFSVFTRAVPLEEALAIAQQIAEAVAYAPKSVTRSFYLWYGTNERLGIAGYGPVRG